MAARYTLILGTQNRSSWSLRPFMALSATGQAFETIVLRLRRPETREEILKFSSAGKVPVLKIVEPASSSEGHDKAGRTQTIWDSLAICETIAERHPEAGLWPADAGTRAMARSYAAEMHSGFPDVRDQLALDYARIVPLPELRPETGQQVARIVTAWEQALKTYGDRNGFLFGRFSIADCMYAPVVSRLRTYGVAVPPAVQAYCERMWALPAMQAWLKASEKEVADGIA